MHLEIATPELLKYSYQDFITAQVDVILILPKWIKSILEILIEIWTINAKVVSFILPVFKFTGYMEGWNQGTVTTD